MAHRRLVAAVNQNRLVMQSHPELVVIGKSRRRRLLPLQPRTEDDSPITSISTNVESGTSTYPTGCALDTKDEITTPQNDSKVGKV